MPIQELIICGTPYHPQQTSTTPQRAPELISVQYIGIKLIYYIHTEIHKRAELQDKHICEFSFKGKQRAVKPPHSLI